MAASVYEQIIALPWWDGRGEGNFRRLVGQLAPWLKLERSLLEPGKPAVIIGLSFDRDRAQCNATQYAHRLARIDAMSIFAQQS